MTPADELRAAAEKLRALASDATEDSWHSEDPNRQWGDDHDHQLIGGGKILATFKNDHNGPLNALYSAAMHPGVGASLADWLDVAAANAAALTWPNDFVQGALAVARAINGGQS